MVKTTRFKVEGVLSSNREFGYCKVYNKNLCVIEGEFDDIFDSASDIWASRLYLSLNGQLRITYSGGSRFCGTFVDGSANGFGDLYYSTGDRFVGEFCDNEIIEGTYYYANGTSFSGKFVDGKPDVGTV